MFLFSAYVKLIILVTLEPGADALRFVLATAACRQCDTVTALLNEEM